MCFQSYWFQLKSGTSFLKKEFRFPEILFQSQSIENVWNFHWLSHKNMPISQTEGYFENPQYHFLEELMLFPLALKWKLYEKAFSNVKTKTNSIFAVKVTERSNHPFLLSIWWITFFRNLYECCIEFSKSQVFPCEYH